IRALYQDKDNNLWIGTLGGGLNILDIKGDKFYYYKNNPNDKSSLSDNSVSAIYMDREGFIWVGTWGGGLNRSINPVKNLSKIKFINYTINSNNNNNLKSNIVQSVYEDSKGRIWIGTGTGLSLYIKEKNVFINFINDLYDSTTISSNQVQS